MTQIKCPNCAVMNPLSALECAECGLPFSNLPPSAFVETDTGEPHVVSRQQTYKAAPPYQDLQAAAYEPIRSTYGSGYTTPAYDDDGDTGKKTFMWYRVYLGALSFLYLAVSVGGMALAYFQPASNSRDATEMMITGMVYAVLGAVFFITHVIALSLPVKPYNWIVGIVFIALGMTSCCLWPATIPLLIFWIKPETRRFFGRT